MENPTHDSTQVSISHITHRYSGSFTAVDDVSAQLGGHHVTGLLGANGAGKSTLMNIICGVLTPTDGDVTINGYSIQKAPVEAKRHIGFLPQKPPLLPDLTVEEYLRYSAELRLMVDSGRAVDEAISRCGLEKYRKRLLKHLSGGYQQRAGIAQAIIHKPSCIVLDEPTNGLDPIQIVEIRHLIHDIAEDCLVLLSTHILHEVELSCDHILMMSSGHLVFDDSLGEFTRTIHRDAVLVSMGSMPADEVLLSIPEVNAVSPSEQHPGFIRLAITGDADTVCEKIIALSSENGWHLHEIMKEAPSADDIFKFLSRL